MSWNRYVIQLKVVGQEGGELLHLELQKFGAAAGPWQQQDFLFCRHDDGMTHLFYWLGAGELALRLFCRWLCWRLIDLTMFWLLAAVCRAKSCTLCVKKETRMKRRLLIRNDLRGSIENAKNERLNFRVVLANLYNAGSWRLYETQESLSNYL